MLITSITAAVSVLAPIVLAAPASVAFNETDFDQLVPRDDYNGGAGKAGIEIQTFQEWHCGLRATVHGDTVYDHNYPDGKFKSYMLSRDLKSDEYIDFSSKAGGTTKRDTVSVKEIPETSPLQESPLEARAINPLCADFFHRELPGTTAGCHDLNSPASCFRLWQKVDVGRLLRGGRVGTPGR